MQSKYFSTRDATELIHAHISIAMGKCSNVHQLDLLQQIIEVFRLTKAAGLDLVEVPGRGVFARQLLIDLEQNHPSPSREKGQPCRIS